LKASNHSTSSEVLLLLRLRPCRQKPSNVPEFNRSAAELCATSNNTEGYGNPRAWGWASAGCQTAVPFMCKMQGALTVRWEAELLMLMLGLLGGQHALFLTG
jgi:hypothetical protein